MGVSQIELMELQDLSLAEFLSSVFGTNEPLKSITGSKKSIFTQIGIYRYVCVCVLHVYVFVINLHVQIPVYIIPIHFTLV